MRSKVTAHILTDKMSEVIDHPGVGDRCALCCRSEGLEGRQPCFVHVEAVVEAVHPHRIRVMIYARRAVAFQAGLRWHRHLMQARQWQMWEAGLSLASRNCEASDHMMH